MENQKNNLANLEIDEVIKNMCYIKEEEIVYTFPFCRKLGYYLENEYIPIENLIKPFYREMCDCVEMIRRKRFTLKKTKNILCLEIKKNVNFEKNTRNDGLCYSQREPKKVYNRKTLKYEEEAYPLVIGGNDNTNIEKKNLGFSYKTVYIPYYHILHSDCDKKKEAKKEMIEKVGKPYDERIKECEKQKDNLFQRRKDKMKELKEKIGNNNYDWNVLQNTYCWRKYSSAEKQEEQKKMIERCGFDVCIVIDKEINELTKQITKLCERITYIARDKDDDIKRRLGFYTVIPTEECCIKKRVKDDKIDSWTQTSIHKWSPLNLKVWNKNGTTSNKGCKAYYIWKSVNIFGTVICYKEANETKNVYDEETDKYVGGYKHWTLDGIKIDELKEWCKTSGMKMKEGKKSIKHTYGDLATFFLKYEG
jgi:uncharacterized protein YqfB (UPF0267 family)